MKTVLQDIAKRLRKGETCANVNESLAIEIDSIADYISRLENQLGLVKNENEMVVFHIPSKTIYSSTHKFDTIHHMSKRFRDNTGMDYGDFTVNVPSSRKEHILFIIGK